MGGGGIVTWNVYNNGELIGQHPVIAVNDRGLIRGYDQADNEEAYYAQGGWTSVKWVEE